MTVEKEIHERIQRIIKIKELKKKIFKIEDEIQDFDPTIEAGALASLLIVLDRKLIENRNILGILRGE